VLRTGIERAAPAISPPQVSSKKGRHNGNLRTNATESKPTIEEQKVANKIGKKTNGGSAAPCWARYIKIVTGNKVSDELLSTKNKICALEAVFSLVFKLCSECMARKPLSLAALSRHKPLAVKFNLIRLKTW